MRHALPFRLLAAAALCGIAPAHAASFALWFEADADSRWYDLYVGHFAELSRTAAGSPAPNIVYLTESESDPFAPVAYDESGENLVVFAQGSSWDDVGTLTYSGSGNGTFPITGMTLDIPPFVQSEDASALGVTYVTELSGVTGTITFDGGASDIQAQGTIRFVMDASFIPPLTTIPFEGTFVSDGNRFDIFVDDDFNFGHGVLHHAWDLHGTIVGVGSGDDVIFRNGFDG